ncbi:MAG: response regulator [Dehalococcoidia bacterium]
MELPTIRTDTNRPSPLGGADAPESAASISSLSVLTVVEQAARDSLASVMVMDASGLCGWLNPGTKNLFGVEDGSALVGRLNLWEHCTVPGDPQGEALERAFRGEAVELPVLEYNLDGLALGKSSSPSIRVSARLLPLLDEVGGLVALYVFNRPLNRLPAPDVGSLGWRQDSQEDAELRRCIAVAKGFSRKLAHDFNNHLAVMQGFASILQNRLKEDEQNRELAAQIELSGAEALKLTSRLSHFSNDLHGKPVPLDLNQLVQEAIEVGRVDQAAEIDLVVELDAQLPVLLGDQDRLTQLCRALWQNAVEAMPQGGSLSWRTSLEPARKVGSRELVVDDHPAFIRLQVRDTGVGMDEKTKAQMLDPFFTTKAGKARGLGMTEVYETVRSLQGFMEVDSQPEQGTSIEIYLPVEVGSPSDEAGVAAAERPKRLLVVDDEPMLRDILKNFLVQEGYEVVAAADGEEALKICSRPGAEIDAVILDMTLPGIDGVETFDRLRQIDDQMKVVIATGDPYRQSVHDLMRRGAAGMLSKPFRPQHLSEVIKQLLA